jgi:histidinol-phosphate phosphatase family protein
VSAGEANVVVLDRDGTIIVDRHYLDGPEQVEFLPNAAAGLRLLCARGYRLIIVTSQSGVGRGLLSLQQLEMVHERLCRMVHDAGARIERIYYCPHTPQENCDCRKPRLGLLLRAAEELGFEPSTTTVVGDKPSDIEFGLRAGATTILVGPRGGASDYGCVPDLIAADLWQAARQIIAERPASRLPRFVAAQPPNRRYGFGDRE